MWNIFSIHCREDKICVNLQEPISVCVHLFRDDACIGRWSGGELIISLVRTRWIYACEFGSTKWRHKKRLAELAAFSHDRNVFKYFVRHPRQRCKFKLSIKSCFLDWLPLHKLFKYLISMTLSLCRYFPLTPLVSAPYNAPLSQTALFSRPNLQTWH